MEEEQKKLMEEVRSTGMAHERNKHIQVIKSFTHITHGHEATSYCRATVGVYIVENKKTGELYIGSSLSNLGMLQRYRRHFSTGKTKGCKKLSAAMDRDGRENFIFHIVLGEEVKGDRAQYERVRKAEAALIEKERPAYNSNKVVLSDKFRKEPPISGIPKTI